MDPKKQLNRVQRQVIQRLRQVALGQPIGRPADKTTRQPWQKLGKHKGTPFFDVECSGCGRTHYFQLKKENGVWCWRPYNPYGRRFVPETKPLKDELVTEFLKRQKKSSLEQLLDEYTHDADDKQGNDGNGPHSATG